MSERKRVLDRTVTIDCADLFDGRSLDEVRLRLNELAGEYEQELMSLGREAKFSLDYYGYDGGFDLSMQIWRDENDREYAARLATEARTRERNRIAKEKRKEKARQVLMANEAAERAEYERLKAKYGSWEGQVDRQSGAFTQEEIDNATKWQ